MRVCPKPTEFNSLPLWRVAREAELRALSLSARRIAIRFGVDATKFVNSPRGLALHLRGINARVIAPGRIRTGDRIQKLRTNPAV